MPPATILLYEEMNKYIQISHLPDRWNLINTVFLNWIVAELRREFWCYGSFKCHTSSSCFGKDPDKQKQPWWCDQRAQNKVFYWNHRSNVELQTWHHMQLYHHGNSGSSKGLLLATLLQKQIRRLCNILSTKGGMRSSLKSTGVINHGPTCFDEHTGVTS